MKILKHALERRGDHVKLSLQARDTMRRPVTVRITIDPGEDIGGAVVEGDVRQINGLLNGLAEAAWANGWRPRGLAGMLAHVIGTFKIPPEQA